MAEGCTDQSDAHTGQIIPAAETLSHKSTSVFIFVLGCVFHEIKKYRRHKMTVKHQPTKNLSIWLPSTKSSQHEFRWLMLHRRHLMALTIFLFC